MEKGNTHFILMKMDLRSDHFLDAVTIDYSCAKCGQVIKDYPSKSFLIREWESERGQEPPWVPENEIKCPGCGKIGILVTPEVLILK